MSVNVIEQVTKIVKPAIGNKMIVVSQSGYGNNIPKSIGQAKGDLILFRGRGDPVRMQAGNVDGRILVTDSSSPTGWSIIPNSSSSGSSVTLHNSLNSIVPGGTIVKIDHDYDFVKATSADTSMLFVTAEDCDPDEDVVCYGVANTICSVLCTSDAVEIGDQLGVSSTDGIAETVSINGFAVALTDKASGSTGSVNAIIVQNGFLPLTGGTLTGNIELSNTRINAKSGTIDEDATPESNVYYAPYEFYDKNGNKIGHLEMYETTSGGIGINYGVRRKVNGAWTWKQITMEVKSDGTISYSVPEPASYRSALGVTDIATRPDYQVSTTDLTAGTSSLTTGKLYYVYS